MDVKTDFKNAGYDYLVSSLNVVSLMEDKTPTGKWKHLENQMNTDLEGFASKYFKYIGIVCGRISGFLTVIDVDLKYDISGDLWQRLQESIQRYFDTVPAFPIIRTRSGGYHIYFRSSKILGNTKLAERPATQEEIDQNPKAKLYVLLETRGEGGYVVAPPSENYDLVSGNLSEIPMLSNEDHDELLNLCRAFDEKTKKESKFEKKGKSIFNDYNQKVKVLDILTESGWSVFKDTGDKIQLTRPGKSKGVGGTVFTEANLFHCFTSSSEFENGKTYGAAAVYATLFHDGDFGKTAKDLQSKGYESENKIEYLFWYETTKETKNEIIPVLGIDIFKLYEWLRSIGIQKLVIDPKGLNRVLIQISENIVKEIDLPYIQKVVNNFLNEQPEQVTESFTRKDLIQEFSESIRFLIDEDKINFYLPFTEIDFLADTKNESYFFFKNGWVTVNNAGIKLNNYSDLHGFIWESQIIKHDFERISDKNSIINFAFTRFTQHVCTPKKGENIDEKRWQSLCNVIGYLLHNNKTTVGKFAITFTESNLTTDAQGRTGKGLIMKSISKLRKVLIIDGKTFKFDTPFAYQAVELDTKIIFFDDVEKSFDFQRLYSVITEGLSFEKKQQDRVNLKPEDSPKIAISTNYAIKGNSESDKGRKFDMELFCYYNSAFTPAHEFDKMFFDEWTNEDWNIFYNFMFLCSHDYFLNLGRIPEYDTETIGLKRLIIETNLELIDFANNLPVNEELIIAETYQNFLDFSNFTSKEYTKNRLSIHLKRWAIFKGYEFEARVTRLGGITVKVWRITTL